MRSRTIAVMIMLILAIGIAYPNGLSLNSIGPKGFGMGGAFVGLADDYTAVYWNPSGLTQMQNNFIGAFATDVIPMGTYKFPAAGIDAKEKTNNYISPNLMGMYHFGASNNLTFGLGVYVPAGIGSEWEGNDLKNLDSGRVYAWMSKIAVVNISPSAAYKFSDNFSIGVAVNILYGMFDLQHPGMPLGQLPRAVPAMQFTESSHGFGCGMTIGALYKASDKFSVGVTFRSQAIVKMSGTMENPFMASAFDPVPGTPPSADFTRDIGWPMWIAGGIAFRPIDNLVVAFDVQYSAWSKTEDTLRTEFTDPKWELQKNAYNLALNWNDATQIRLGADYTANQNLDLRAGVYIDPAPAPDETYSILFPSISYTGISLGAGYKVSNFVIDLGMEYLIGKDRDIAAANNVLPGTYGMNIPAWSLGVGYAF